MATVIVVTNQKGGVGKTTTCAALAGIFRSRDKTVLAIDMDPQGNLSFSLGAEDEGYTIHDVMTGKCDIRDAIKTTNICDVITSNILLSGSELELTSDRREFILKDILRLVRVSYDYVIIDTPPALSVLTIKKYYNKNLNIRGILLTKYVPKQTLATEVEEMVEIVAEQLKTQVLDTKISVSVAVAEAPAHQEVITTYSPNCRAARDYIKLAESLYPEIIPEKKRKKTGSIGLWGL